ncbi:MAG: adenosine deaminase [Burkholderiales bacterium PBB3]|nr:MAG: adenosine deaminase [Burkholderiales bacterium PBB3]
MPTPSLAPRPKAITTDITADADANSSASDDACYLALKARDARFDGRFFTAVTSTGIYCRPVCKVRCPKRENCRFFPLAAQAEQAGFRPCLRCRPELAPSGALQGAWAEGGAAVWSVQDASSILAQQAARLLDAPDAWSDGLTSMNQLAERLGVSERHVRRIFEAHWGVSPLQYWQTRRLLTAKQLLTDTRLPVAQVAGLSGFASVRRFNDAFVGHYRLQPRALRKEIGKAGGKGLTGAGDEALVLRAAYRPPYDVAAMLQFFATRQIEGVEHVDLATQTITRTLSITPTKASAAPSGHSLASPGNTPLHGWVQAQFVQGSCNVTLRISASLGPALPTVLARLRAWLDLDADPQAINALLLADFPGTEGLRVPGTLDGFELAVRAVLGQQITVAAARTLGTRLVAHYGEPLATHPESWAAKRSAQVKEERPKGAGDTEQNAWPFSFLASAHRLFPTAAALAKADPDVLGQLGIVKQRQKAIQAIAQAVVQGQLSLHPGADVPATMAALQALPGIGPWTAHYIALRALRWPDAFPAGDVALHKALGVQGQPNPQLAAETASQRWRPWRSYAVLRAWARLNAT